MSSKADFRSAEEIRRIGIEALAEALGRMQSDSFRALTWAGATTPESALMCLI